ncbi:helix-turn-helix transcriptional regulator [Herbiconiux liukaitaii]|uniref:helix-turn-helix transcriptional regulator n=1 Tax=Herbiconiux liukaitaii TaxID=3342799 RepID=UPI0035B981CA
MTRTTGRTLALLGLLQARREWTGADLLERLEVSERTLRRDIDDLRSLGYGIEARPGVGGGYRLGAGASVPPLTLSPAEAVAIAVGLRAAALAVVTGIEDAAAGALAKLEKSLSASTRDQITAVERAMVPLGVGVSGGGAASAGSTVGGSVDLETVVTVAHAIGESRRLGISYRRHDGERVERRIEPHRIVHTTERWYLLAWEADRAAWRTLRMDRIVSLRELRETFTPRSIPDDQLRAYTTHSITSAPYRLQVRVRLHAPLADAVQHFGPTVAQLEAETERTCLLRAGAGSAAEIALHLGLCGLEFDLLEGEEVRAELVALAARFTRAARDPRHPGEPHDPGEPGHSSEPRHSSEPGEPGEPG